MASFSAPFKSAPYNPDRAREWVRAAVTLAACATFFCVVYFYLTQASKDAETNWPHVKEAMQSVLPAVTSVLGTSLGFYFGSQKS